MTLKILKPIRHFYARKNTQMREENTPKEGEETLHFSSLAHRKVFAHIRKHPNSDVSGALLVREDDKDNAFIEDAIPLFHSESGNVSVLNEIALTHIQKYANTSHPNGTMRVGGLYFANGNLYAGVLPDRAQGLAEAVGDGARNGIRCVLLEPMAFVEQRANRGLDMGYIGSTEKVSTSNSISPFRVFKNNANNNNFELKEQDKGSVKVVLAPPLDLDAASTNTKNVCDFDDHFDDVGKDWRNASFS